MITQKYLQLFLIFIPKGLDINKIMPLLDFIVIDFACFNKCTKGLKCGGVVPVDGKGPYTMVLILKFSM